MAGDPSIRGLTGALETALQGVKRGQIKLEATERPFCADRPDDRKRDEERQGHVLLA